MGLLDGDLTAPVGAIFGWLMLDAVLHPPGLTAGADGSVTASGGVDVAVKGMIDSANWQMREADDFQESDVALLILRDGAPDVTIDHELTIKGSRYKLLPPLVLDAAETHWTARGRLKP